MNGNYSSQITEIKLEKDPFRKARLISFLNKEKNISIKHLSVLLTLKASYICNILRLLRLPEIAIDGFYAGSVSLTHLLILSRIKNNDHIITLYEKILSQNMTVSQTEVMVREHLYGIKSDGERLTSEEKNQLIKFFTHIDKKIKTTVTQTRIRGRIMLEVEGGLAQTSAILKKLAYGKFVRIKSQ